MGSNEPREPDRGSVCPEPQTPTWLCQSQAYPNGLTWRIKYVWFSCKDCGFDRMKALWYQVKSDAAVQSKARFLHLSRRKDFHNSAHWRYLPAVVELHVSLLHARQPYQPTLHAPFRTRHSHDQPI